MIVKRITPSKIKLGVHIDSTPTNYRFYSVANDIVVWFKYMYQANTYYSNDVLYIDLNNSQVITNNTYDIPYLVVIQCTYQKYKALNGKVYTLDELQNMENTTDKKVMVLNNNNGLYTKLINKINQIRRLHTSSYRVPYYFSSSAYDEFEQLTKFTPLDGHEDRNTRPYHVRETLSRDMTLKTWGGGEQTIEFGITNNGTYNRLNDYNRPNTSARNTTIHIDTSGHATISANNSNVGIRTYDTPTQNYSRLIASYHSGRLLPNTKYHSDSETITGTTRYFGIELETELNDQNRLNEYTHELNNLINDGELGKRVKFEEDGSLRNRGCEIITQPMTPKYIIENREKIKEIMNLINRYATSHDNGRCGMHIHVSRASLTEDAINEIYFVVETFKKELIAFSRRQSFNYCAFHSFNTSVITDGYKYIDKDYFIRHKTMGHYCCLNNANTATLEFRFLRGTTNLNTFMASVELIDNICNMVMDGKFVNGTTWLDIINYNDEYEDLKRYNERRNITSTKEYNKVLDLTRSDR